MHRLLLVLGLLTGFAGCGDANAIPPPVRTSAPDPNGAPVPYDSSRGRDRWNDATINDPAVDELLKNAR